MGRIIEGVWDCKYCGADKIRGSVYKCPNCGRQRDNDVTFYIDNPKNYISKEAEEKLNKNPDWLCSFCDALNSDDNETCYNCGASKEDSEANYFENKERQAKIEQERLLEREKANASYDRDGRERSWDTEEEIESEVERLSNVDVPITYDSIEDELNDIVEESHREDYYRNERRQKKLFSKKLLGITAGVLAVILAITGLVYLFTPKIEEVTIQSFEWERNIEVEEYKTVKEDDWSVPAGGRVYDERTEIKTYVSVIDHYETKTRTYTEQVLDHYEEYVSGYRDLGNGHFEEITSQRPVYRTETRTETYEEPVYRQDPVYATKYYYEIERWLHKENLKTSGKDQNPYWYEYTYKEKEREGSKSEKYSVVVKTEKDKIKTYDLKYDEWVSLKKGQTLKLKVHIGGNAEIVFE